MATTGAPSLDPAAGNGPFRLCAQSLSCVVTVIPAPAPPQGHWEGRGPVHQALLHDLQAAQFPHTDLITLGVFQVQVTSSTIAGNWIAGEPVARAQLFPDVVKQPGWGWQQL